MKKLLLLSCLLFLPTVVFAALPTILVNSATGSDTAASGAGPGTALTGTAASFAASVVTLDGTPDLSGVAADGSHVLYMVTSTGVRFFKITAVDNGADTVTVTPAPAGTATGRTWAIGGKRASIGSASSILLVDNGGAAGDAMPGWIIEMESGHTETVGSALFGRRPGDTTSGPITLRGTSGAATRPILSFSADDTGIRVDVRWLLEGFEIKSTGTKTNRHAIFLYDDTNATSHVKNVKITDFNGTAGNKWQYGVSATVGGWMLSNSEIANTTSHCAYDPSVGDPYSGNTLLYNYLHDCGGAGYLSAQARAGAIIVGNIFDANGADGVQITRTTAYRDGNGVLIAYNVFYGNTGDGFEDTTSGTGDGSHGMKFINNIFANNGGYGINTALSLEQIQGDIVVLWNNNFYSNTSGKYDPSTLATGGISRDESTADPTFTDAANGDFRIGTNLKALGFPTTNIGSAASGTRSYVDIGAAQRVEPAGGGGPCPRAMIFAEAVPYISSIPPLTQCAMGTWQ